MSATAQQSIAFKLALLAEAERTGARIEVIYPQEVHQYSIEEVLRRGVLPSETFRLVPKEAS